MWSGRCGRPCNEVTVGGAGILGLDMKSRFILRSRLLMRCAGRILEAAAILLCAASTLNTSVLSGAGWSEIDSGLPRTVPAVKSLVVDSATPSTLYAIDTSRRLFKSIDSGGSWNLRGSVSGVNFVVVDPTNSSTIYAATEQGVLKSTDGGENWTGKPNRFGFPLKSPSGKDVREAGSGLANNSYVWTIAIDPLTPATLYAVTYDGVYKSTDAARSWNKLNALPPDYYAGGIITIDPVTPSTIYLAYAGNSGSSILRSTDGGQSWNRLNNTSGIVAGTLVLDPITPSTLYVLSFKPDGYILKSTDGGQTWAAHPAIPPGSEGSLAIDPVTPSTLYAVSSKGLGWVTSKSMDSGENWTVVNTGAPPSQGFAVAPVGLVAISRTTPATVYTGYFDIELQEGHLAKSTDGGATWNAADTGLAYIDVHAVAIDPVIPSNIYAGMGGLNTPLFKSVDGGASWTNLAQFQFGPYSWISALLVGSANPNLIHAAVYSLYSYGIVFNTTDGGAHWVPERIPVQTATVLLDTAGSNTIYLGGYDPDGCDEAELYKSVDGGSTWIHSYEWDGAPVSALVIDPTNAAAFYAGTGGGVFKSADGGATWTKLGLTTGVTSLALDPGDPNTIYAAAGNFSAAFLGLFKSTDGGASWTPIDKGLLGALDSHSTVNAIVVGPNNRSTLYVATSGQGVYKSVDGGASWAPFNDGLTDHDVRLLAVAGNALYAATSTGVFKVMD